MNPGLTAAQEAGMSVVYQADINQKETAQIISPQNQLSHATGIDSPQQSSETSPIDVVMEDRPPNPVANQNGLVSNVDVTTEEGHASQTQSIPPVVSVTPPENQSPIDTTTTSSHYSSSKTSRSRQPKTTSVVKGLSSLTAIDMHNFGSTSSLTYDSFWSSHSGSATPRPAKAMALGPTDSVGTLSATLGFSANPADFGRSNTISTMTSTSTLHQQE